MYILSILFAIQIRKGSKMGLPTIMVRLNEEDKLLVERAAKKERVATAAWVRTIIVDEAYKVLGERKL
jgi:uncharacterized protein (DUF1778 family)